MEGQTFKVILAVQASLGYVRPPSQKKKEVEEEEAMKKNKLFLLVSSCFRGPKGPPTFLLEGLIF